jgi:hypothetical protein
MSAPLLDRTAASKSTRIVNVQQQSFNSKKRTGRLPLSNFQLRFGDKDTMQLPALEKVANQPYPNPTHPPNTSRWDRQTTVIKDRTLS